MGTDDARAVDGREPQREIEDDAGEKPGLGDAQQGPQNIEPVGIATNIMRRR